MQNFPVFELVVSSQGLWCQNPAGGGRIVGLRWGLLRFHAHLFCVWMLNGPHLSWRMLSPMECTLRLLSGHSVSMFPCAPCAVDFSTLFYEDPLFLHPRLWQPSQPKQPSYSQMGKDDRLLNSVLNGSTGVGFTLSSGVPVSVFTPSSRKTPQSSLTSHHKGYSHYAFTRLTSHCLKFSRGSRSSLWYLSLEAISPLFSVLGWSQKQSYSVASLSEETSVLNNPFPKWLLIYHSPIWQILQYISSPIFSCHVEEGTFKVKPHPVCNFQ